MAEALAWPRTRVELVESGRVRLEPRAVVALAGLYRITEPWRSELIVLADEASRPTDADALAWITSHSFRKTNATILDDAGLSARQIADQLGHARPSLTMDVYMGRGMNTRVAAGALEGGTAYHGSDPKSDGFLGRK